MKRCLCYSILALLASVSVALPAAAQTQLTLVSAASYDATTLAPEAIVSAFGARLATTTNAASALPLPTTLSGTTVNVKDSAGTERAALLFFVSPTQVNFQLPAGTAIGPATVTIRGNDSSVSTATISVVKVAPGLFAANATGRGVAAAQFLRIGPNNTQSYEPAGRYDASQNKFVPVAVNLGPETEQVYLVLYATGARFYSALSQISAKLGDTPAGTLEHILPQNPGSGNSWSLAIPGRERQMGLRNALGNLSVLTEDENSAADNRGWADKRPILAASAFLISRHAAACETWSVEVIERRTAELIETLLASLGCPRA